MKINFILSFYFFNVATTRFIITNTAHFIFLLDSGISSQQ